MERSELKKRINRVIQVLFPLLFGLAVLAWTYYGFDFQQVSTSFRDMDYGWMAFSLVFGVLGHLFRGWRWSLTLEPLGEYPKQSNCVYAIFVSYAANLVVPRIGEVSRCGILLKYDGVSFSKSLGTVVTERLIDTLCVLLITAATVLLQSGAFAAFFERTGTRAESFSHLFSSTNFFITLGCLFALCVFGFLLLRKLAVFSKMKGIFQNIWKGCMSLRDVKNLPLFIFYTVGIWVCYYFQFYVSFFAFDFSADLGWMAGLVMFVVGSIAVVVPTPNGAGPWHFAIITMMMMYGICKDDAGIFALLVHAIQTFLLILLGIYGLVALQWTNKSLNTKTHIKTHN